MDGPWYECTGPNADYVRRDQYRKYRDFSNISIGFKPYMIMKILVDKIPDTMTDFGSYRGYATFGLEPKLITEIKNLILLKKKFLAAEIIHDWYNEIRFRPGRSGYQKAKAEFMAAAEEEDQKQEESKTDSHFTLS